MDIVVEGAACTTVDPEQQFWNELTDILSAPCDTNELLDNALRSWLDLVAKARDELLHDEDDVATCSQRLITSPIFSKHQEYVRTQIIYSLLQEDDYSPLHVIANFLLSDGRAEEETFKRMIREGCFLRLLELIRGCGSMDSRLHRLLLQLMYEMSRIERLRFEDLMQIDDGFVTYLFQLIEALADDANDPYHYSVIRVLLVLNEQYMVAATSAAVDPTPPTAPMTNRVIKLLSIYGSSFRTFGENIILLLNRETETSQQLLILKLLYLLFTTAATYEYFYTNDLHVLLDVIIRNLLDLPSEMDALRHTYLRVLAPLLAHTQLSQPPHYKRDQILSLLEILRGSSNAHFKPPDPTTVRLVERVAKTAWLVEPESDGNATEEDEDENITGSPSPVGSLANSQTGSAISVIAKVSEKPGVTTPSIRKQSQLGQEVVMPMKESTSPPRPPPPRRILRPQKSLPEVPMHRHGVPFASSTGNHPNHHHNHHNINNKPPPPLPRLLRRIGTGGTAGNVALQQQQEQQQQQPQKKLPPKLPPPRRKAKPAAATTGVTGGGGSEASTPTDLVSPRINPEAEAVS
ncbi:hypothetical protein QBC38DRAFT_475803 [Podospora fimiseda]|uniref:SPIN90/Ldb17 leucine-rich domain-containing protein n=1 Tax=Podospora fimiseda TaxID=252190 RepID=A0AAN7BRC9_9PEZI|nr:hypothetical protein QBC38DRAFT_475803 [Podospora fimiseda]